MKTRLWITRIIFLLFLLTSCRKEVSLSESNVSHPEIHPDFTLTLPALESLISDMPPGIRTAILEKPQYFMELTFRMLALPEDILVLVNKETGLSAADTPEDLIPLDNYNTILHLSRSGHNLRQIVLPSLLAMNEAAGQEGLKLMISSTYRSYDYQTKLYNRYVEQDGKEAADRYSAQPGKSQHQLGMVIDFGTIDDSYADTLEGKWLKEHAGEYGFSLSYPAGMEDFTGYMWECWHFRYLTPTACEMEKEFFNGIQEYMLSFFHEKREALLKAVK